jgi:hypothetical protein
VAVVALLLTMVVVLGCCAGAGAARSTRIRLRGGHQTSWPHCCSGSDQMMSW